MNNILIISVTVFALYYGVVCRLFGCPWSISDTYYSWEKRKKGLGIIFTLWCYVVALTVMPLMIHYSEGQWFQFLSFFSGGGLAFVGTAPLFKTHEKIIHYVSAGVCAVSSLSWVCLMGMWHVAVIALVLAVAISIKYSKWMNWIEVALFASEYASLFILSYNSI